MGIATRFDHGLMGVLDRFDIFAETSPEDFRFAAFDGVADQAQQNFRDVDIDLGAVNGVGCAFEFLSVSFKPLEAFVELLRAKGNGTDSTGIQSDEDKQQCRRKPYLCP